MSQQNQITMTVSKKGKKWVYTVTMPDGSVQTRNSGNMYTSCVVVDAGEGKTAYNGNLPPARYVVGGYSSSASPKFERKGVIVGLSNPDFFDNPIKSVVKVEKAAITTNPSEDVDLTSKDDFDNYYSVTASKEECDRFLKRVTEIGKNMDSGSVDSFCEDYFSENYRQKFSKYYEGDGHFIGNAISNMQHAYHSFGEMLEQISKEIKSLNVKKRV